MARRLMKVSKGPLACLLDGKVGVTDFVTLVLVHDLPSYIGVGGSVLAI